MPDRPGRYWWVSRLALSWAIVSALAGLTYLAALVLSASYPETAMYLSISIPVLAVLGLGLLAATVFGAVLVLVAGERQARELNDRLKRMESLSEALHESNKRIVDLAQMSDAAKSLLFRQREIEAMQELLHEYLISQEYTEAEALVNDIQRRFGYAEQVQQMRQEIAQARQSTVEQKVAAAIDRVHRMIEAHDWAQAMRHARRLAEVLPNDRQIATLPQQIRDARIRHKSDLLAVYGEAVKNSDIDRSIALLHELDKYLTPQEAAAMEESARGVFRAKLHNLGVQFAIRVNEENWPEAVAIGEQIIREYPNSRMAQEAALKMDRMRQLAAQKPR